MVARRKPYFSIGIPVFNGEAFIEIAVRSVLRQTFTDWRLIVVDNQSTDQTWSILTEKFGNHPQVALHRNDRNLGMAANLNRILELADGKWLGILPADDAYAPHGLESIHRETFQRESLILWMHAHLVRGSGITANICPVYRKVTTFKAEFLAEQLYLRGNIFGELSSYFLQIDRVRHAELAFGRDGQGVDYEFWIRTLKKFPESTAVYWPDVLAHVWQHPESGSSTNARSGASVIEMFGSIGSLAPLGWRKNQLLRQIFRILLCWIKFRSHLPSDQTNAPWDAIRAVFGELMKTRQRVL